MVSQITAFRLFVQHLVRSNSKEKHKSSESLLRSFVRRIHQWLIDSPHRRPVMRKAFPYIQQECHSVLVKLHPITFYRTVFLGSARFLGWMPLFVFFGLPIVSYSLINTLILGSWLLVFVLNNTLILGIWCSAISHLPGCFFPWTFFQNIGFNKVPSAPFLSHLATQLGYSAGGFQALQLIVLAAFGVVD